MDAIGQSRAWKAWKGPRAPIERTYPIVLAPIDFPLANRLLIESIECYEK